ncbi:MAG: TonB-dependent receptor [Novosphingobium sp.]|nr:TonB-dependent receptor [Novosphingobium sp.]
MKRKILLCASVAAAALAASPAIAQTNSDSDAASQNVGSSAEQATVQDGTVQDDAGITVTGLRRSLETAQRIKRESEGILDAVVAEDIGKLPDTFASSALQRLPGVGVTRGGGESAGVTVRGLPDLTTTYNGRQIFTAEGRYVQIQDFPAGTVAALEVYKSGTADQIEGGIAGEVNVRGRRPFDFSGFELSGSLNGVNWQQSGKLSWNGNLLVSDRWDTGIGEMGLLVNVSYVGINFLDSTREQSLVIATTDSNNAPGAAGLRYPDAQGIYQGYGDRWRPSANAAFQWKPSSELEIYADGLFQGFRSKDYNRWMFIPVFGGTLSNVKTIDGTDKILSATVTGAVTPDGWTGSFNGKTDTYQGGAGAIWQRGGLKVSTDVAYTDSTYTADNVNIDYTFAGSPVRDVVFEASEDGGPTQIFRNFNINDPANFVSRGLWQEYSVVSGKDWQARGDVSYEFGSGFLKRIQAGIRYDDRKAGRDLGNLYIYNLPAGIPMTALPGADVRSTLPGFDYNNVMPNTAYAAITRDSIRDNLPALRAFYGAPAGRPPFNPFENFRANEKAYAAYAQVKYGFDLGSVVVDGLVGLRAVKTKTNISGFGTIDGVFGPITAKNEYTDYLPNVSTRVAFNDKLQLRLAFTQTRTRPNFFDLRPTLTLGSPPNVPTNDPCYNVLTPQNCFDRNARAGGGGNPYLDPLTSDNYDASLEYYFSRTGSLTFALFRHDAKGFLATVDNRFIDPQYGPVRINQPVNTGSTRLQGAEVSFTSFLDLDGIPNWMKGFGVQANGTFIDAKGDLIPAFAATLNNEQQPFTGVSKWAGNVVLLFEKPVFSARVAYNYRSKFVNYYSIEALDPTAHAVIEKARGQLDFSTTVTPVPNVTIAFDVVNVLGNPLQRYRQYDTAGDSYTRQVLYLERTYSLGVRFHF